MIRLQLGLKEPGKTSQARSRHLDAAEAYANRQPVSLRTDHQTIQAPDHSVICLNARRLIALWPTSLR
ncbi:hypothetical protein EGT51_07430 [Levilactobacillus suantsaiihabitans]|uniref:Uncharacterized protein n=1 Tax=Levilactobacillus suantsaiihabitans TaxID=2487722 RepID=A0A4Z0J7S5_9LACO|nr:hypothetical protein EGT51_07430 [Levilactobacillus suantsaiihabitans]